MNPARSSVQWKMCVCLCCATFEKHIDGALTRIGFRDRNLALLSRRRVYLGRFDIARLSIDEWVRLAFRFGSRRGRSARRTLYRHDLFFWQIWR